MVNGDIKFETKQIQSLGDSKIYKDVMTNSFFTFWPNLKTVSSMNTSAFSGG